MTRLPSLAPLAPLGSALGRQNLFQVPQRRGPQMIPDTELPPEEEQSLLGTVMGGVQYVAEMLDKPGSAVRGLLAGRPGEAANLIPFSGTFGLTDASQRTKGRDLLEQWGVAGRNQPGLFNSPGDFAGDVGGFLLEVMLDPLWAVSGPLGAVAKAGKGAGTLAKGAKVAETAAEAATGMKRALQATGEASAALTPTTWVDEVAAGRRAFAALEAPGPLKKLIPGQLLIGTGKKLPGQAAIGVGQGAVKAAEIANYALFRNPASVALRSLIGPHMRGAANVFTQIVRDRAHAENVRLHGAFLDTLEATGKAEKKVMGHIQELLKHHGDDPDAVGMFSQVMREWGEQLGGMTTQQRVASLARHAQLPADTVKSRVDVDLMANHADDFLHSLADMEDNAYSLYQQLGGKGDQLTDAFAGYLPRRLTDPLRTRFSREKKFAHAAAREIFEHRLARNATWRDVPGGTEAINRWAMNPALSRTAKAGVATVPEGAAKGIQPGVIVHAADRQNYGKVLNVADDGKTANVFFRNPKTGLSKEVSLPMSQLKVQYYGAPGELVREGAVHYRQLSQDEWVTAMREQLDDLVENVPDNLTPKQMHQALLKALFKQETDRVWESAVEKQIRLGRELTPGELESTLVVGRGKKAPSLTKEQFLERFSKTADEAEVAALKELGRKPKGSQLARMSAFFRKYGTDIAHGGLFDRRLVEDHTSYMTGVMDQISTLLSTHKYLDDVMTKGKTPGIRLGAADDVGTVPLAKAWTEAGYTRAGLRTFATKHFAEEVKDLSRTKLDKFLGELVIDRKMAAPFAAYNAVSQAKVQNGLLDLADRVGALYKGMLTVSGGPVWGTAFHTRNLGSGFWNSATDGKVSVPELLAGYHAGVQYARGKGELQYVKELIEHGGLKGVGQAVDILSEEAASAIAAKLPKGPLGGFLGTLSPRNVAKAFKERGWQAANLFSTRGVYDMPKSLLGEAGEKGYNYVEFLNRAGYYEALRKKGYSIGESLEAVKRSQYNYAELADFEKTYLRRMVPFYCVPTDTEILTRRGWKHYNQLTLGEQVLGYDLETQTQQWTILEDVSVFDYDGVLMVMEGRKAESDWLFTPNHRWPVRRNVAPGKHDHKMVEGYGLRTNHAVPISAPFDDWGVSAFTPREAAIIGWLITDGHMRKKDWVIYQSPKKFAKEIRGLLGKDALAEYVHPDTGVIRFPIKAKLVNQLKAKGFRGREDASWVIGQLDRASAEAMWDAMYKADGTTAPSRVDSGDHFAAQNPLVFDAAQMLVQLFGMHMHGGKTGGYVSRSHQWCKVAGKLATCWYKGQVWCPQTSLGTWVMRRGGRVVITGNSWARKNVPRQVAKIFEQPGGKAAQTYRLFNQGDDEQYTPSFLREGMAVRAGGTERAATFFKQAGIPIEDLNKFVFRGGIPSTRTLEKLASQLHPLIAMPIESFADKQFYTGRARKNLASTTGELTEALTGTPRPSRLADNIIHYSPVSRAAGELLGWADLRKSLPVRAVNALTGLKFSTYDAAQQRLIDLSRAMEEELRKSPAVREGSYFYVPEDQKAQAQEEQEQIRRIGGLHRAMKVLREEGVQSPR